MSIKTITPQQLHEKLKNEEKVFLLDVRAEDKYHEYHIEVEGIETHNIPKNQIFECGELMNQIPEQKEMVITCTTGNSATKCAAIISEKDYNVLVLEGGVTAWKEYIKALEN